MGAGYTAGFTNDLGSVEDIGVSLMGSGVSPSGYEEFPTLSLPPGLVDKQGYKVMSVAYHETDIRKA